MMDDEAIIAAIQEAVAVGNFEWDTEHCYRHMGDEGFALRDAIRVVAIGAVIGPAPERNRWLFCATISSLTQDPRFYGRWLHVLAGYDDDDTVVSLVTMYRPSLREWRTERDRR